MDIGKQVLTSNNSEQAESESLLRHIAIMSRRRGEFEHRTSIFEGAFRAWSHLGGLDPDDVENKPATELDPLSHPLQTDPRIGKPDDTKNPDGSPRQEYPYEPLPRSGLAHPYVQAILSPWLGPDADNEAIQLGLTTLRTWWQHRRKGESGSAIAALGTEKMKGVVEGYTRHFFTLAHCIVVSEKVQPPRTLHSKMKDMEKIRSKSKKKKKPIATGDLNAIQSSLMDPSLTPLEKLHIAQRHQQESTGTMVGAAPIINLKGKCVPGKIDLPGVVDAVNRHTQFVHRGGVADGVTSGSFPAKEESYGDPNSTPVVFVSSNGYIQIALKVDGITCAHCVKIVETVLRGCNGNKSPIRGLLDAAADRDLCSVLIRIDKAGNAKRIAFESTRNLSMVGYTAKAMSMSIVDEGSKGRSDLNAISTAFEVVATTKPQDVFDWTIPCTCPDNGVLRGDCMRHSQMNTRIFEAFNQREQEVKQYMAGCGMKYGMDCTCGPSCSCRDCPIHSGGNTQSKPPPHSEQSMVPNMQLDTVGNFDDGALQIDQPMQLNNFGMELPQSNVAAPTLQPLPYNASASNNQYGSQQQQLQGLPPTSHYQTTGGATRNPSILSYRGSIRHNNMSITSETFGRAMSGLSALSIDWENLEDFDVDLDHSANIQQQRASIRRSIVPQAAAAAAAAAAVANTAATEAPNPAVQQPQMNSNSFVAAPM